MGLDFDVLEFCKKLRIERPPPYQCPLEKCDRVYKSLCGLQYHLVRFDHETGAVPALPPPRKKGGRLRPAVPTGDIALQSPPREALTFAEAHKVVQFEIDGKISRIAIDRELPVIALEDWTKRNSELEKPFTFTEPVPEPHIKLPEASYKVIDDYNIADAPTRPNAYIRFIEKSAEELDGEVEYDVDEEDTAWLSIINEKRQKQNFPPVSIDTLELLMDRLEKESYFQATQSGQQSGGVVDDDAVCCICMDGECQNTNVILFCDMCNLAVHQDCYGVPYIPEGQWLCRRCLQSPSRLVNCVLCPNTGGAFKQTDRSQWAHVVCALWIPEVRFANTVFLEPIDSIETIPPARWKLTCYICKQRSVGACIQCHRNNCYSAFHVTCAQQAGLYMKMDAVNGTSRGGALDAAQSIQVAKIAYCDAHTPAGVQREKLEEGGGVSPVIGNECVTPKDKMKQARRMLAKKRSSVPVVLIPMIPPEKVQEIASMVQMSGKAQFVQRLIAYWTLKRQYRNGVPLLRRLQSLNHHSGGSRTNAQDGSVDTRELYNQLKYWQRIRQDLERARLLCELVRKRERMKAELTRVSERCLMHQLKPTQAALRKLLSLLQIKDSSDIFSEPVDQTEVPDYSSVVSHPMDLSTMIQKLDKGLYDSIEPLEKDFELMISNCLAYNSKETVFYKAGVKMKEQGSQVIKQAKKEMLEAGLLDQDIKIDERIPSTPKKSKDKSSAGSPKKLQESPSVIEEQLDSLLSGRNLNNETVQVISSLAAKLKKYPHYHTSPRLAKKIKNVLSNQKSPSVSRKRKKRGSQSDGSGTEEELSLYNKPETPFNISNQRKTPILQSPSSLQTGNPSPTGVNRRTAVLFTRKAQSTASFSQLRLPRGTETPTLTPKNINLGSSFSLKVNESLNDVLGSSTTNSPIVKKKGRGRPRKHNKDKQDGSKNRLSFGGSQEGLNCQTPVPASFLVYRGPRDEAGSGADSDSARSSASYSSCSSCSNLDDMSTDSECCSTSTGSDDSSFNDTLESTTNQTFSDAEQNVTRMSDVGIKKVSLSKSRWSSERSDAETDTPPIIKKRRGRLPNKIGKGSKDSIKGPDHISMDSANLQPLQLVWAKCRGYPWYPALIMDPKIPKGFIHNGVPLPVPPQDVLALKKNHAHEPVLYLVLFFDAKRTWQWLPPNKLELLGLKKSLDQAKLVESRKPTERKAVKKAFQDAMQYQRQVDGEDIGTK